MITIDGSMGEGGGQVLRTALALSLVTAQPFVIERIRARRAKPGLARQHLTCVEAAAAVGRARVEGAELGSQRLVFKPVSVHAGDYRFSIGTAGSTTLVLQTVLPALLRAGAASEVMLGGGTHNPLAPPFEFLQLAFAPALRAMGASLDLELVRYGFAPAGGGAIAATIRPSRLEPVTLLERKATGLPRARVLLAQLSPHIGERELAIVRRRLGLHPEQMRVETVASHGPGNMLLLEFPGAPCSEVIGVPGERDISAEQVAENATDQALAFLAANVPVGEHLADQLLPLMAIARGGAFRTLEPSLLARTNAQVIERFLPVRITFTADAPGTWLVAVERA
jgi:RNA 3'-terminal phosphate cyclase (ATP)